MTSSNVSVSRIVFRALALPVLFLLASCSSYQDDFRAVSSKAAPTGSPKGAWKGSWKSEVNGHHGPLWCLVSQDDKNSDLWDLRYRAGWGVLQFGDYTHTIVSRLDSAGTLPVEGTMTLPKNFGTYTVNGTIDANRFQLRYQGNGDKGTMTLKRP